MSTLDDFFAKKDRKKKGLKSGDLKNEKKGEKSTNKKDKPVDITDNFKYINDNSDEWLDFEENRDKDYSGLRIQTFTTKEKEETLQAQRLAEAIEDQKNDANAWSSKSSSQNVEEPKDEIVEEEKPKEPEQPPVVQKYIPPSLRRAEEEAPKKVSMRNSNKAPALDSKSDFPTLG